MDESELKSKVLSTLKHDMNNVLTGVTTALDIMAMDDCFEDPSLGEELNDIQNAAQRLKGLIEDLGVSYLPSTPLQTQSVNSKEIEKSIIQELSWEHIQIELTDTESLEINCDPLLIKRGLHYISKIIRELKDDDTKVYFHIDVSGTSPRIGFRSTIASDKLQNILNQEIHEDPKVFFALFQIREIANHHNAKLVIDENGSESLFLFTLPG